MSQAIGRKFGRFFILGELVAEREATVFQAFDPRIGSQITLTIVRIHPAADGGNSRQILERARKLLVLDHPHLVPTIEAGLEGDSVYLLSPVIEGTSLIERINRGPIPFADTALYFKQISSGLEHAHSFGVYHLALQPRHILLDQHSSALVGNFGLTLIRERWTASALSQISGELHRAPEQELGGEGDARSDQYALGGLLFRMLTGYTTLSSGIPVGDVILRMNERAARLPNQPSPVPSGVAVVILKAT
jgi:serine/threonine-protein kinase